MRVFLCDYGEFFIAIPMSFVSSLALLAEDAASSGAASSNTAAGDSDDLSASISLPLLFGLPSVTARHGITLNDGAGKSKIVLLSAGVEREAEIPDEEIYPVPKALSGTRFSALFSGIKFAACPVLVLKPGQSLLRAQTEAPAKQAI